MDFLCTSGIFTYFPLSIVSELYSTLYSSSIRSVATNGAGEKRVINNC